MQRASLPALTVRIGASAAFDVLSSSRQVRRGTTTTRSARHVTVSRARLCRCFEADRCDCAAYEDVVARDLATTPNMTTAVESLDKRAKGCDIFNTAYDPTCYLAAVAAVHAVSWILQNGYQPPIAQLEGPTWQELINSPDVQSALDVRPVILINPRGRSISPPASLGDVLP
jgi:hypothetical protein